MKNKKIFCNKLTLQSDIGLLLLAFMIPPIIVLYVFSALSKESLESHQSELILWVIISIVIALLLLAIKVIRKSDYVIVKKEGLQYYKNIFTKKSNTLISFNRITRCVISDGLWKKSGDYVGGKKIFLFDRENIFCTFELNEKLAFLFLKVLDKSYVRVVNDNRNLSTISRYYGVEYESLSEDEQMILLRHYCKMAKSKERNGYKLIAKKK